MSGTQLNEEVWSTVCIMLRQRGAQLLVRGSVGALMAPLRAIPVRGIDEFFAKPLEEGEKRPPAGGLGFWLCFLLWWWWWLRTAQALTVAPLSPGRAWAANELRLKSFDDLHKLWFVLLKEKNMLLTERLWYSQQGMKQPDPTRLRKVWLCMRACLLETAEVC